MGGIGVEARDAEQRRDVKAAGRGIALHVPLLQPHGRPLAGLPSGLPAQPSVQKAQGAVQATGAYELGQVRDLATPVRRPIRARFVPHGAGVSWLEEQIQAARQALDSVPETWTRAMDYASHKPVLLPREWHVDDLTGVLGARADSELVAQIKEPGAEFALRDPEPGGDEQRRFQAVTARHGRDWSQLYALLRSSIAEGDSVSLSLFDEPDLSDGSCPPIPTYQ